MGARWCRSIRDGTGPTWVARRRRSIRPTRSGRWSRSSSVSARATRADSSGTTVSQGPGDRDRHAGFATSRLEPGRVHVLRVEVLSHCADLAVPDRDQHVVFLVVDTAVAQLAVRHDLERDLVALGDRALHGHPELVPPPTIPALEHARDLLDAMPHAHRELS